MKKTISILLAVIMLAAACCAAAETAGAPLFATYGDALLAAGEQPVFCGREDSYAVVVEKDGKFFRVVTELDETARAKAAAFMDEMDYDKRVALEADLDEYLKTLPVTYVEELTAVPIAQDALDALAGKTISELEEAGFSTYSSGTGGEEDDVVFNMTNGLYNYDFVLNESYDEYAACEESGDYSTLTVKSAAFAGPSWNAADLEYLADGTFTGQTDLFADIDLGPAGDLIGIITAALNGEDGADMDPDALMESLIELMPEQEDLIRELFPVILSTFTGEESFSLESEQP